MKIKYIFHGIVNRILYRKNNVQGFEPLGMALNFRFNTIF